jgi:hypothetical protein
MMTHLLSAFGIPMIKSNEMYLQICVRIGNGFNSPNIFTVFPLFLGKCHMMLQSIGYIFSCHPIRMNAYFFHRFYESQSDQLSMMNVAPLRLNPLLEKCALYTTMYLVSMYNF